MQIEKDYPLRNIFKKLKNASRRVVWSKFKCHRYYLIILVHYLSETLLASFF